MPTIEAICISKQKHTTKEQIDEAEIIPDHGLLGDAHAGSSREVSLLSLEGLQRMQQLMPELKPGDFAENLTVRGLDEEDIQIGTRLIIEDKVELLVTQIGKKCHHKCDIYKQIGSCIMPAEGIFAKVLRGGRIKKGASIKCLKPETASEPSVQAR